MKTVNLGVIGCGNAFRALHLPAILSRPDVRLLAAADTVRERAEGTGAEYVFEDWRELLALPQLDAVDICMPTFLHQPLILAALKAGKDVLCEKPDAMNYAEMLEIDKAVRESGRRLAVIRNNRYLDSSAFLKSQITEGRLGEIYHARCGWIRRRGIPGRGGWITTKAKAGGGVLIDLGVHMIDLAIWLMGDPKPVAVTGNIQCRFAGNTAVSDSVHTRFGEAQANGTFDVEDFAVGFVRFEGGQTLELEFSWASNIEKETRYVSLLGDKAGAEWRDGALSLYSQIGDRVTDLYPRFSPGDDGHEGNIHHFFDVLTGQAVPDYKTEQGLTALKIIDGVYRSAAEGREIVLA